ncbi:WD40/YVTN/BNR-like repeat-containing protein [Marinobacter sp. GN3S48]|uniref:WD40/YVTN/BNR-like repeat-containing protein n=1 Tax=Marinobacter sp. GN3S48 TaxID=3382302 RepID=UPI00387B9408
MSPLAHNLLLNAVGKAGHRLVAVGERGTILLSNDEGNTWSQSRVPVSVTLTDVAFVSDDVGFAVGHSGVLLETRDGGETWVKRLDGRDIIRLVQREAESEPGAEALARYADLIGRDGPDKPLLDIWFDPRGGVIATGAFGLMLQSNDGGKTWESKTGNAVESGWRHLYAIVPDGERRYLVGEQGRVLLSNNDGEDYKRLQVPYDGSFFGALLNEEQRLLVYGLRGNVLLYDAVSGRWQRLSTGTNASLSTGVVLEDGTLLLASNAGEFFFSKDNGMTFTKSGYTHRAAVTDLIQLSAEDLVLATTRGVSRVGISNVLQR